MSEKKDNFTLNLFGTDVDFSAIATDNVPEADITGDIWEEKLSFLMLWKNPAGLSEYENRQNMQKDPCGDCEMKNIAQPQYFIPECRKGHGRVEYVEACERKNNLIINMRNILICHA